MTGNKMQCYTYCILRGIYKVYSKIKHEITLYVCSCAVISDEDEERLLVDWFTLIHEKHLLVRREAELVYT